MLFELNPYDPLTLEMAIVLLVGIGALASFVPARRAPRADPITALRGD